MYRTVSIKPYLSLFQSRRIVANCWRFASSMSDPPQLQNVALSVDSGSIAVLKYNRPKNANALNTAIIKVRS